MSLPIHLPQADPTQMTGRARTYLLVAAIRHTILGLTCLLTPERFANPAFDGIKRAMPGPVSSDMLRWGVLFLSTGALCMFAAWLAREGWARWALLASIVSTALLAGGFLAATIEGVPAPTGLVGYLALTAKDLVVLRQPLRSPFEPLIRRVLSEPRR